MCIRILNNLLELYRNILIDIIFLTDVTKKISNRNFGTPVILPIHESTCIEERDRS